MSLIEKKFSDFQKSECDELDLLDPIEEDLCPTCIPDPNFKLDDYWYRIADPYLHKGECEYKVVISSKEFSGDNVNNAEILESGCYKLLVEFNKVINNQTLDAILQQAFVSKTQADPFAGGAIYYEVSVSAFIFDNIPNKKDEEDNNDEESFSTEIVFDHDQLFAKLVNLRGGLRLFSQFYSTVAGAGDVQIFYVDNPSIRLNYDNIVTDINNFIRDFNSFLDDNKFEQIDFFPSVFKRRRRALKYKLVLDAETPFSLKEIWIRTEDCGDEYEQVDLPQSNDLYGPLYQTVYAFLSQIDTIVSDLLAKEPKPWAEFTKEYVYPRVQISYGDLNDLPDDTALKCLFENSFGLGQGKLVDSLAREAMSIFRTLENDLNKEMCRNVQQQTAKNPQALSAAKKKTAYEEREAKMKKRFEDEFVNNIRKQLMSKVNEKLKDEDLSDEDKNKLKSFNSNNIMANFNMLASKYSLDPKLISPRYGRENQFSVSDRGNVIFFKKETEILAMAKAHAKAKFDNQEQYGNMNSFRNSPHWAEAQDSWNETFGKDNAFRDLIMGERNSKKTPEEENEYKELHWIIKTIGLCGISKTTAKLLKCLAGGVSIDDFYDVVIDTMIEAMNIKDLARLFNIIPASLRIELEEVIEQQFGGTSLTQLLGLAAESGQRASDFINFSDVGKIISLFEKTSKGPLRKHRNENFDLFGKDSVLSEQEKTLLRLNLGDNNSVFLRESWIKYLRVFVRFSDIVNNEDNKLSTSQTIETPSGSRTFPVGTKGKKYIKKYISNARRSYLAGLDDFAAAGNKIQGALSLGTVRRQTEEFESEIADLENELKLVHSQYASYDEKLKRTAEIEAELRTLSSTPTPTEQENKRALQANERAAKALKETNVGVKIDAVFDVAFGYAIDYMLDLLSVDKMIEELSKYPGADIAIGIIVDFFKSCPNVSLFRPPVKDFLKTFSLDVCDPEIRLTVPMIEIPNLSLKNKIDSQFGEIFEQTVIKVISDIAISLINRTAKMLEDLVCNLMQTLGTLAADFLEADGEMSNSWYDALDAAFCNGATDPATGERLAKQMADALVGQDPNKIAGTSSNIANIIGSVTSQDEILRAMVDGDERVNRMVSNAVKTLAPEFAAILGSPDKVAMFFKNIGSYLSPDDRRRIRDLLDAGVPNLPISAAICLTSEQLDQWDNLRRQLLQQQGFSPDDAAREVAKLNDIVKEELRKTMGDALELDTDAPFIGAITDEILNGTSGNSNNPDGSFPSVAASIEDACAPNSIFNDNSMTSLDKDKFKEARKDYMGLVKNLFKEDSFSKDGIFGHALKDKEGRIGFSRGWYKFWIANYQDSAEDREKRYENASTYKQGLMDARRNGEVEGDFPDTIGLYLKENLENTEREAMQFDSPRSFSIVYSEEVDDDEYKSEISFNNLNSKTNFSYNCNLSEFENGEDIAAISSSFAVQVPISKEEIKYLSSLGIPYEPSVPDRLLRRGAFINYVDSQIPFVTEPKTDLYAQIFETFGRTVVQSCMFDKEQDDLLPYGFKFGYEADPIDPSDAFEYLAPDGSPYELDEEAQILGDYKHPRVIALDPKIYGGRYTKPPYAIDPVKHKGWLEIATRAWEPREGCEPYTAAVFDFEDITNREDILESTLVNYPELTKDEDCRLERPFKLLVDKKIRARMDSTVRITVRSYVAEYYLKSLAVFSNIEYSQENFDNACIDYIVSKMSEEMRDLGDSSSSTRLRIKRQTYWYAFLEQAVQVYLTMQDRKEIVTPPEIVKAMEELYECQISFPKISPVTKKNMRIRLKENNNVITRINDISRRKEFLNKPIVFGLQAIAWRFSSQDKSFFDGGTETSVSSGDVRFARLSKIQFFAKFLAIAMYEEECKLVLRELVKVELKRIHENAFSGFTFKSSIFDMNKAMVGLPLMFEESTSNVGYNSFYLAKQAGTPDTGDIPNVTSNIASFGEDVPIEEPKFVVQKYVRMTEREGVDLPDFIKFRPMNLTAVSSVEDVSNFFEENLELLEEKYISDYFGDLEFTYKSKLSEIFAKGFINNTMLLLELTNLNEGLTIGKLNQLKIAYTMSRDFEDIEVIHTSKLLLENESKEPHGTTGSTGIKYGIRICVLLPSSFTKGAVFDEIQDINFKLKCEREKAYLFKDGKFLLPLVSSEYDVVDSKLVDFDPIGGVEAYDLECSINKMVQSASFKIMFNKIFPLTMFTSAAALYSFEGFMPSVGQSELERSQDFREDGKGSKEESNQWTGTVNKKQKKFLRREFASLYLSSKYDGQLAEGLFDEERTRIFKVTNPFAYLRFDINFNIPWFVRRRMKQLEYDANGENCADPLKDFQ
jgi:hypothetical protein